MKRRKIPCTPRGARRPRNAPARRERLSAFSGCSIVRARPESCCGRRDRVLAAWLRDARCSVRSCSMQALYTGLAEPALAAVPPVQAPEAPRLAAGVSVVIPAFNEGPMVERSIRSVDEVELSERSTRDHRRRRRLARRHVLPHAAAAAGVPDAGPPDSVLEQPRQARGARGGLPRRDGRDRRHDRLRQRGRAEDDRRDGDAVPGRRAGRRGRRTGRGPQSRHDDQPHARGAVRARVRLRPRGAVGVSNGGVLPGRAVGVPARRSSCRTSTSGRTRRSSAARWATAKIRRCTNIVLREGYDTVYQRTATIHTLAPDDVPAAVAHVPALGPQLHRRRVQLRAVHVHAVPHEEPRAADRHVRRLEPAARPLLLGPHRAALRVRRGRGSPPARGHRAARSARSSRRPTTCASSGASASRYGLLYAVYSVLLLQWILPWALITVRDERWGTR